MMLQSGIFVSFFYTFRRSQRRSTSDWWSSGCSVVGHEKYIRHERGRTMVSQHSIGFLLIAFFSIWFETTFGFFHRWAASDLGWVVGHSFICYGPLLAGLTTLVYEGKPVGTPDAGQYFRVIQDHRIQGLSTAPTALRAIRREDPELEFGSKYDTSSCVLCFYDISFLPRCVKTLSRIAV